MKIVLLLSQVSKLSSLPRYFITLERKDLAFPWILKNTLDYFKYLLYTIYHLALLYFNKRICRRVLPLPSLNSYYVLSVLWSTSYFALYCNYACPWHLCHDGCGSLACLGVVHCLASCVLYIQTLDSQNIIVECSNKPAQFFHLIFCLHRTSSFKPNSLIPSLQLVNYIFSISSLHIAL